MLSLIYLFFFLFFLLFHLNLISENATEIVKTKSATLLPITSVNVCSKFLEKRVRERMLPLDDNLEYCISQ